MIAFSRMITLHIHLGYKAEQHDEQHNRDYSRYLFGKCNATAPQLSVICILQVT